MSTVNMNPSVKDYVKVLVKAYDAEPVMLWAISREGNSVEVIGNDPDKSISYPAPYVYQFNNELHANLVTAFKNGEQERLMKLWKEATKY